MQKFQLEYSEQERNFDDYQGIRDFVQDLTFCLRDKIPQIDKLEKDAFELWIRHRKMDDGQFGLEWKKLREEKIGP